MPQCRVVRSRVTTEGPVDKADEAPTGRHSSQIAVGFLPERGAVRAKSAVSGRFAALWRRRSANRQ